MANSKYALNSQSRLLIGSVGQPIARASSAGIYVSYSPPTSRLVDTSYAGSQIAYGPPQAKIAYDSQTMLLLAESAGATNLTTKATQVATYIAYATGVPGTTRSDAWTYVMDGHRMYVLPLGAEGDWQFDTTTHEWSQIQTQGFPGFNMVHGTMWDLRVIGGDSLYPNIVELDPSQPLDDGFRPVQHIVTGGIAARGRHAIGVSNFTLTASVGDDATVVQPISLAFSDDNGVTYSPEFPIPLTDVGSQQLIWNALGSFAAPGRVFRITDYGGPIRIDGADVVLSIGSGADSGQDDDGSKM